MPESGGLGRTPSLLLKSITLAGEMATKPEDHLREREHQTGWGCPHEQDVSQDNILRALQVEEVCGGWGQTLEGLIKQLPLLVSDGDF